MKKNIGIMSMQRIVNYGSFLQAYGLKKTINELGYNVNFIDYHYEKTIIEKKATEKFINKIKNNLNIFYFINKKLFIKKMIKKYNSEYLPILINNNRNNVQTLVIGSDEVFNCLQDYPVGYSKELFGKNYENIKVISYAASFGHTTLEGLKSYSIDNEIGQMLKKFQAISVRDKNSYDIVEKLTKTSPYIHLDPVLISDYSREIENSTIQNINNYIILYAYTGRITKKEEKYIKKFAKIHNKKIVSLGFYQSIADMNLIVNPFAVLKYFKYADFVITDTFHGTVFSIKMNTKFCSIIRDKNYNKLNYLLTKLKHLNQKANDVEDIERIYNSEISFKESNNILEEERRKSINYLKHNL